MAITQFTNFAQVARKLSAIGIDLRTDHSPVDAFDEACNDASLYVLGILGQRYPAATLAGSAWVANVTSDICIYFLDMMRNNTPAASSKLKFEMWTKFMQEIQQGKAVVPDVTNAIDRPEVMNQRVDYGRFPAKRVSPLESTEYTPTGYPRYIDETEPNPYPE